MIRLFVIFVSIFISGLVIYLSWIPNPAMTAVGWMPGWLGKWADAYPRFRTAVPFFGLGILVATGLVATGRNIGGWLTGWLALTGLVVICELGQWFIPRRVCDLDDILWGGLGAACGLAFIAPWAIWRKRHKKFVMIPPIPVMKS